jgi:hypothetical protein
MRHFAVRRIRRKAGIDYAGVQIKLGVVSDVEE